MEQNAGASNIEVDRTNVPMTAPDNYIIASLYSAYNTSINETRQQCNYDMNK